MTPGALVGILEAHERYLRGEPGGTRANLYGATLAEANLYGATLAEANLTGATLTGATLAEANLTRANLTGADLFGATLTGANLYGANLTRATLTGATLTEADLFGATLDPVAAARLLIIPPEGDVIGWKKCNGGILVKLRIPDGVRRHNATGRKCRAECAEVLEVIGAEVGETSYFGPETTYYRVGETVYPHAYEPDRWLECAPGIHFYITREEAEAHR